MPNSRRIAFTEDQLAHIKARYQHVSAIVIAAELKTSPQTICRRLKAMGVSLNGSGRKANPNSKELRRLKSRDRWLQREYGITLHHYDQMVQAQNGECAICRSAVDVLHVDHDHRTGNVRALLCKRCNIALGLLEDDPSLCGALAAYLGDWGVLHGT